MGEGTRGYLGISECFGTIAGALGNDRGRPGKGALPGGRLLSRLRRFREKLFSSSGIIASASWKGTT